MDEFFYNVYMIDTIKGIKIVELVFFHDYFFEE